MSPYRMHMHFCAPWWTLLFHIYIHTMIQTSGDFDHFRLQKNEISYLHFYFVHKYDRVIVSAPRMRKVLLLPLMIKYAVSALRYRTSIFRNSLNQCKLRYIVDLLN